MRTAIERLVFDREGLTAERLRQMLAAHAADLTRDEWSGLFYAARDLAQEGHYDRARALLSICRQAAERAGHGWAARAARFFTGDVHALHNDFQQAVAAYRDVVEAGAAADCEDGHSQAALAWNAMAGAHLARGHLTDALHAQKHALALEEKVGWTSAAIGSRLSLATIYLLQEEFATGEALLRRAVAEARAAEAPILTATAFLKLADLYEGLNDPESAGRHYRSALAVLDDAPDDVDADLFFMSYGEALVGLGTVYQETGRSERAVEAYAEAARLAYMAEDQRGQARAVTWLATAQLDAGRPDLALRAFHAAARLARRAGDTAWLAVNCFFWASAWQALKAWDRAEAVLYESMAHYAAAADERTAHDAGCLAKLGEIAVARDAFGVAVERYRRALAMLAGVEVGQMQRVLYLRLGEAYWYQGDYPHAYAALRHGLDVYEGRRQTLSDLWRRVDFAPSRDLLYEYLVRTCLALGKPVEALLAAEEDRLRVFREQLAARERDGLLLETPTWAAIRDLTVGA